MAQIPGQIKHIAIISDRYTLLARFYEALFGMWTFPGRVESASMGVSDGHVGLNFNLRAPGRQAGLDHYGFEIESADTVIERAMKYPSVDFLRRPSNRPFVGISLNDPAGNVFDLSERGMANRDSVYDKDASARRTVRRISHFLLRALDPDMLAEFYRDVFDLVPLPRAEGDPNHRLSDGQVTMVIGPWSIRDYAGTGIARPAMDHLGFEVESIDAFSVDLERIASANTALSPQLLTATTENRHRLELLRRGGFGELQLTDPDGVLINVHAPVRPAG